MAEISYLIPKRQRPIWVPELEPLSFDAGASCEVPLLGWITAGQPIEMYADEQRVDIPASMVRRDTYALRVRGHSMIDDNIQDGDIVVIERRQTAENGQSVVAMINGEQVTLKKFYVERDGIRLQPANPDMQPIWLNNDEVQILGIVTGVIRHADGV